MNHYTNYKIKSSQINTGKLKTKSELMKQKESTQRQLK